MKKTGFNLVRKIWCTISLCAGILTGCDLISGDSDIIEGTNQSIRPCKIDMTGVQGFAIVANTSNAPRTKADRDGDGIDDETGDAIDNGTQNNGSTVTNTSPYSLYTIDANGKLQVSIFYFEAVPSEDGQGNNAPQEVIQELTGALQVVPSLVTDLGRYILFSDCQYQIVNSKISDEARAICESFIQNNMWGHRVYMIRKADGALFDLSNQPIFSYYAYGTGGGGWWFYNRFIDNYDPTTGYGERWSHIPSFTYTPSAKGNLFVRGWEPNVILKIEDNGDAVTVTQVTQDYRNFSQVRNFAVDKEENIYEFFNAYHRPNQNNAQIDIYYANGGFNAYDFKPILLLDTKSPELFDIVTDESGASYIFLRLFCSIDNNGVQENGLWVLSASLSNGEVSPIKEDIVKSEWNAAFSNEGLPNYHYLGYYKDCFNWYLPLIKYENNKPTINPNDEILSYNKATNTWSIKQISTGLMSVLSANYDVFTNGKKSYGANINGNNIEVTEIDIVSETSRQYTLSIDMPIIVSASFNARMVQDVPYLTIDGRNTENGAGVSITVNLINGETNSSFAQDGRNVVSFFRIN